MHLPQNSSHIEELRKQGHDRRLDLRSKVGKEFTSKELMEASGLSSAVVRAQIQNMLRYKEVEATSDYKTPRTYKVLPKGEP